MTMYLPLLFPTSFPLSSVTPSLLPFHRPSLSPPPLQLCAVSNHCTSFFSRGVASGADGKFISESCEVYAFGSNSSSQLAMGSMEKYHKATLMTHMANIQVVSVLLKVVASLPVILYYMYKYRIYRETFEEENSC